MYDYDELKPFPVSNVPQTLISQFDMICKRIGTSRSGAIKLLMRSTVTNAKFWFAKEASLKQFMGWSVKDTLKTFGIEPLDSDAA